MACNESTFSSQMSRSSREATDWMTRYMKMNADMAQSAAKMYSPMMDAWMNAYESLMPAPLKEAYRSFNTSARQYMQGCCDVPETECPPRCACTISWSASEGERRRGTIHIRNTSQGTITYELQARAFEACGKTIDATPTLTPTSLTAAPGQTVTANVEVNVTGLFQPGVTYTSEVLVRGKYERCVKLELEVACESGEVCGFDHGDIPYRTRVDAWYRHFQCSEPCFEPIVSRPTTPGTGTTTPGGNNPGTTVNPNQQPAGPADPVVPR